MKELPWPWPLKNPPSRRAVHILEVWLRHRGNNAATRDETGLGESSISHALAELAKVFGNAIIKRDEHGDYVPGPDSAQLGSELSQGFQIICQAVREWHPRHKSHPLSIATLPGIWEQWLLPRRPKWDASHDRTFEPCEATQQADKPLDLDESGAHAMIDVVRDPRASVELTIAPFAKNLCGPVFAPSYLEKKGFGNDPSEWKKISYSDLRELNYLRPRNRPEILEDWSSAAGHEQFKPSKSRNFERLFLALQAARSGEGWTIGRELYIQDDANHSPPTLVAPLGMVECQGRPFYLAYPKKGYDPLIPEFLKWLREETGWGKKG